MKSIATTAPVAGDPAAARNRGPLDRVLGVFTEVRGGEGLTALLLMLNVFLLLAAYYLLKTIREPLILSVPGGAEVKSYAAAATAGLLILVVPLYSAFASRVSRVKLINGVTLFFIACLLTFFALSQAHVPVGVAFFIWVGIFSLMVIAQLVGVRQRSVHRRAGPATLRHRGVRGLARRDRRLVRDRTARQGLRPLSLHAGRRGHARPLHGADQRDPRP